MPMPTATIIMATINSPPPAPVGGGVVAISVLVAIYAVNVGSCSIL